MSNASKLCGTALSLGRVGLATSRASHQKPFSSGTHGGKIGLPTPRSSNATTLGSLQSPRAADVKSPFTRTGDLTTRRLPHSMISPDDTDADTKDGEVSQCEGAPTAEHGDSSRRPHLLPSEPPVKKDVRTLTEEEYEAWALKNIRDGRNTEMP